MWPFRGIRGLYSCRLPQKYSFSSLSCRSTNSLEIRHAELRAWRRLILISDPHNVLRILASHNFIQASKFHSSSILFNSKGGGRDPKDDDDQGDNSKKILLLASIFVATALGAGLLSGSSAKRPSGRSNAQVPTTKPVTWNDFYHNMLLAGEVEEVVIDPAIDRAKVILHPNAIYKGQRVSSNVFPLEFSSKGLEDRLREIEEKMGLKPGDGISVRYERITEEISLFLRVTVLLCIVAIFYSFIRTVRKSQASGMMNPFSGMSKANFTLINPNIRFGKGVKFSDVAGLREAKIEVREFVDYLKNPDKYRELGAKPPKGAIMFGPPGCGKTLLAKAVANESNVPFLSMNGSEFIEMIGGLGAARVRSLFTEARKRAPSIIYIDEIDAIGRKRTGSSGGETGGGSGGEQEQTLNQLLVEMDGMASTEGVILLASTNRSELLDKALLRPGRFDRHITIDLPTLIERKEILDQHMKGVQLADDVESYAERLATLTPGFSGADLANVVNEAALYAARMKHVKVGKVDFEYAIERVIAGPEKKSGMLNQSERKIVAYHEAGHAIVGWMLKHTDALLKVTILPRTSAALGFAQYTPLERKLYTPEELEDRMCMALGGRAAEALIFNRITTGAQNDLEKVTKMAYAQIQQFGFNEVVGPVSYEIQEGSRKPFSKRLHSTMDLEAKKLIASAYKRTEALLQKHNDALEKMAVALLKRETLNYDDVEALLGPPPHGKKHLVSPAEYEKILNEESTLGSDSQK